MLVAAAQRPGLRVPRPSAHRARRAVPCCASGQTGPPAPSASSSTSDPVLEMLQDIREEQRRQGEEQKRQGRMLGNLGQATVRLCLHTVDNQPLWQGEHITTGEQLVRMSSCPGFPADWKSIEDAILEGHAGFAAVRTLVLQRMQAEMPEVVAGVVADVGPFTAVPASPDAAWWKGDRTRLVKLRQAALEKQQHMRAQAGQGGQDGTEAWWLPGLDALSACCKPAAEDAGAAAGGPSRLPALLVRPVSKPQPVVQFVVAQTAGQLRSSLELDGGVRLEVQDGAVEGAVLEAKASPSAVFDARGQLQLAGQVLVWLLHVGNPRLVATKQLRLRGVVGVVGRLSPQQRLSWRRAGEELDVSCPGLASTAGARMRLEVVEC